MSNLLKNFQKETDKEFKQRFSKQTYLPATGMYPPFESDERVEILSFILSRQEELYKEIINECIKLSDKIELEEPDGGTKQWMAFKRFRNTLRDLLKK